MKSLKKANFIKMQSTRSGFTMIELLVVATIMIVLTAIGMVSYRQAGITSRDAKRKSDLETVRQALTMYRADVGTYPIRIGSNNAAFLAAMGDISNYLSGTTITDPKNTGTYVYTYNSAAPGSSFTVCCYLESTAAQSCLTNL